MSFSVLYTISGDFGGAVPSSGVLCRRVFDESDITTKLEVITVAAPATPDTVEFVFEGTGPLAPVEAAALDTIVDDYVDTPKISFVMQSDAELDPTGVPALPNDGLGVHTITVTKVDAEGVPVGSGDETLKIATSSSITLPSPTVTLVNGVGTFVAGPTLLGHDVIITLLDPDCIYRDDYSYLIRFNGLPSAETPVVVVPTYYEEKTVVESTTSEEFQQYMKFTTPELPAGTYRIGFTLVCRVDSTARDIMVRAQVDDTINLINPGDAVHPYMRREYSEAADTQRNMHSGFRHVALGAGAHEIDIDYCLNPDMGAKVAYMYFAAIEIWRVG